MGLYGPSSHEGGRATVKSGGMSGDSSQQTEAERLKAEKDRLEREARLEEVQREQQVGGQTSPRLAGSWFIATENRLFVERTVTRVEQGDMGDEVGRHRPVVVELTRGGVLRVRTSEESEGGLVAECFVEDLKSEPEALPRKSAPQHNAIHFEFPVGSNRGVQGFVLGGGSTPTAVRVQLDLGERAEEELLGVVNGEMRHLAERKVQVHRLLSPLLELRHVEFNDQDPSHVEQLSDLWRSIGGPSPVPPIAPGGLKVAGRDWTSLGFQRGDCPSSDLRSMGMLGLRVLGYYAKHYTGMAKSLVEAYCERNMGYPFAAAGINVVQMLTQMVLQKAPGKHVGAGGGGCPPAMVGSPLFMLMTRLEGNDADNALEESFCACMSLLEQLWECVVLWIQDEFSDPTGSLEALRNFDVTRGKLPPDPAARH